MSEVPGQPGQPNPPGGYLPSSGGAVPTPTGGSAPPVGGALAPGSVPPPYEHKTPWTAYIKPIIWTLVAIYVIGFVFLNAQSIVINFIFLQAEVPLIFILVGMTLIGALLCAGVMTMTRRRALKKAQLAAAQTQLASGKK